MSENNPPKKIKNKKTKHVKWQKYPRPRGCKLQKRDNHKDEDTILVPHHQRNDVAVPLTIVAEANFKEATAHN